MVVDNDPVTTRAVVTCCFPHTFGRVGLHRCPLVALLYALLAGCVGIPDFGDGEAAIAAEDIVAGNRASRLKAITPSPDIRDIDYKVGDRSYEASLFLPGGPTAGAIVFVPGLHEDGRHQRHVQHMGATLARLGFAVLVPELAELRRLEIAPENVDDVADAVQFLRDSDDFDFGRTIGLIGISYGAGPAVLAAARADVAADVEFVITLGGYYDITNVVRYVTTGMVIDSDANFVAAKLEPTPDNRWYFAISHLSVLEREQDRRAMRSYLYSKFRPAILSDWFNPPPEGLAADAAALLAITSNENPEKFDALLAALPKSVTEHFRLLDPAQTDLHCLSAEMIFIHGAGDRVVPASESRTFASKVERSRLLILEEFEHTQFKSVDALRQLLPMIEYLLERREQVDVSTPNRRCS